MEVGLQHSYGSLRIGAIVCLPGTMVEAQERAETEGIAVWRGRSGFRSGLPARIGHVLAGVRVVEQDHEARVLVHVGGVDAGPPGRRQGVVQGHIHVCNGCISAEAVAEGDVDPLVQVLGHLGTLQHRPMERDELRGRGGEVGQLDVSQSPGGMDRCEHAGVGEELRDAFVRSPFVDPAHAVWVVLGDEHVADHSSEDLQGRPPGEVDVVCELGQALRYVVWGVRVLVGRLELRVPFAQSELRLSQVSQSTVGSRVMSGETGEVRHPRDDGVVQRVHHGAASGVVDRHQVLEV